MTTTQIPSLEQFSKQAALIHSAHAEYDTALAAYRNRPDGTSVDYQTRMDTARNTLTLAGEAWEKLCEELLQTAASTQESTGHSLLDQMVKFAPEVLETQRICKEASDEYLASRAANHPDQAKLADIRQRLDPAQQKANGARQKWSELCKEFLMSFKAAA